MRCIGEIVVEVILRFSYQVKLVYDFVVEDSTIFNGTDL